MSMACAKFEILRGCVDLIKVQGDAHALDVMSSIAYSTRGKIRDSEGNFPTEYHAECHSLYKLPEMHPEETSILGTHTEVAFFPVGGWWNVDDDVSGVSIKFNKSKKIERNSLFEILELQVRAPTVQEIFQFVQNCMRTLDTRKRSIVGEVENIVKTVKDKDDKLKSVQSSSKQMYM